MLKPDHNNNGDDDLSQVALFMDFENLAISAEESFGLFKTEVIIRISKEFGHTVVRKAYGDWTRFGKYSRDLLEHSIEAIQLFHYGGINDKNAADIQMVVDILEMLFTHPEINVFILATGDSDFSAAARKLRAYGKRVVGIGLKKATSEVLVNACDRFIIYDSIVEPGSRTQSYTLQQARQLLLDIMLDQTGRHKTPQVLGAALKAAMIQRDPTFNENKLGFSQFKDFLAGQNNIVKLDVVENQMVVSLQPKTSKDASQDRFLEYRRALDQDNLHLLDPNTRTEVLRDLYLLLKQNPAHYTLDNAEVYLKAHYDSTNILRSRDEVHETLKLLRHVDVIAPRPQSWELDALSIKENVDQQAFIDECESCYVAALLTRNLPINVDLLAMLLFGTADKSERVSQLAKLARLKTEKQVQVPKKVSDWQLPETLTSKALLSDTLAELNNLEIAGEVSLERAGQACEEGLRIKSVDFAKAQSHFLEAAKILYLLLQKGTPGASLMDLEWHLSSFCSTAAGAAFFRQDYPTAIKYYQAFFSLAMETEPVWEKVERLIQPMLSYYFTVAANQENVTLDASPGHEQPANIVTLVLNNSNPQVQDRAKILARELAQINPALIRKVIQRLEAMSTGQNGEKVAEKRACEILTGIMGMYAQGD